jgi:hypothetical protein
MSNASDAELPFKIPLLLRHPLRSLMPYGAWLQRLWEACYSVTSCMPMHYVLKWQSFRIDALGLVTMIGSEQVNIVVGHLVT